MERFFEFMLNHPFLFGFMGVLIFMYFSIENKRSGKKISPNELGIMVNQQNAQIIDIRPKKQYEQGYIQGSRNVPFTELRDRLNELKAIESPLIFVCDIGLQSGAAVPLIGKDSTCRLQGGIATWKSEGMPLVGGKDKKDKKDKKSKK